MVTTPDPREDALRPFASAAAFMAAFPVNSAGEVAKAREALQICKRHAEHLEMALREPGRPKQAIGEMAAALVTRLDNVLAALSAPTTQEKESPQ